jgi:hypothetical protein
MRAFNLLHTANERILIFTTDGIELNSRDIVLLKYRASVSCTF